MSTRRRCVQFRFEALHQVEGAYGIAVVSSKDPNKIVAAKYVGDDPKKGVALTRPICRYPLEARYLES